MKVREDFKELEQVLEQTNSFWLVCDDKLERLDNAELKAGNIFFVTRCRYCEKKELKEAVHLIPLAQVKRDKLGNYIICCPKKESVVLGCIWQKNVPEEPKKILESVELNTYKGC